MKIYCGQREDDGVSVLSCSDGVYYQTLDPTRSQSIRNHSPDGFHWGYGGSGPAQLALAILLDATNDNDAAQEWYQVYKVEVVSGFKSQWHVTQVAVLQWLVGKMSSQWRHAKY